MLDLINEIMPALLTLLAAFLTFVINRAAGWVQQRMHIEIEARHREALHSAIMSGIRAALLARGGTAEGDVKKAVIKEALDHVALSVPDALDHFNPTPGTLQRLGERYLGEALAKVR